PRAAARAPHRDAVLLSGSGALPAHHLHAELDQPLAAAGRRLQRLYSARFPGERGNARGVPTRPALKILEPLGVRYAMFHMYGYNAENRREVMARLKEFEDYLRPLYVDEQTRLYEIVGFPP